MNVFLVLLAIVVLVAVVTAIRELLLDGLHRQPLDEERLADLRDRIAGDAPLRPHAH